MYKELLKEEDWKLLQASIAAIYFLIAKADGRIDNKEIAAIENILANSHKLKSELASEVIDSMDKSENILACFKELNRTPKEVLEDVTFILDNKLEPKDGVSFKKHLIAIGVIICNASGALFDYKMCHDEIDALREAGTLLGISVKDLEQTNIILDIINSVND